MHTYVRYLLALLAIGFWAGCTSQMYCQDATGQCVQSGGPDEAAATAAIAGGMWVAGGGCAMAGCKYPYVCNEGSGRCEAPRCGEHRDCAAGMRCNTITSVCE